MIKGDKIKLTHKMGAFDNIGEVCEVTDIQDGGVICFKFGNNGCHLGCMSYDEYVKYFEPIVEVSKPGNPKRQWSKWQPTNIRDYAGIDGIPFDQFCTYRTNGKKVQVQYYDPFPRFRGEASCCNGDKFDLYKGLCLAKSRLVVKLIDWQVKEMARNM